MARDYREKIKSTVAAAIAKAGNAALLGRKIGASRQQVSLWNIKGRVCLENYLAVLEFLEEGEQAAAKDYDEGQRRAGC